MAVPDELNEDIAWRIGRVAEETLNEERGKYEEKQEKEEEKTDIHK